MSRYNFVFTISLYIHIYIHKIHTQRNTEIKINIEIQKYFYRVNNIEIIF